LKDLKIPTEKTFLWRAAIANLKIIYKMLLMKRQALITSPPYEIKKLVNKINSFAKQNDDN
jgi:cell division protein FtsL